MKKIYLLFIFFLAFQWTWADETTVIEQLLQEGIELHSAGYFQDAIDKYNEVLLLDPSNISAIYEIALSYLSLGEHEKALLYSSKVIQSMDPTLSIGAYAIQSEALGALGRTEEAITLLEQAVEHKGSEFLLHFNLALNFYTLDDLISTKYHIRKAIDLDKSQAEAFLLYAYVLHETEWWVQSIFAYQMFLLLEPDDWRSREAFEDLLQIMRIVASSEYEDSGHPFLTNPALTTVNGINQFQVFNTIVATLQSLREGIEEEEWDIFMEFMHVNSAIIELLNEKNDGSEERMGRFWTFYVPFFNRIVESEHYETFVHYISVSYFPDSFEWWQEHPENAELFVIWFEEGDVKDDDYERYEYNDFRENGFDNENDFIDYIDEPVQYQNENQNEVEAEEHREWWRIWR